MSELLAGARRSGAFVSKETVEVLRQPRLLVMLLLGPFLILVLFGLGVSDGLPTFRTIFVVAPDSGTQQTIERYADEFASYIEYEGVTTDRAGAMRKLRQGEVDIVAIMPENPFEFIQRDRRAVIQVFHNAADPLVAAAVEGAARLAADEINRQILGTIVSQGQTASQLVDEILPPIDARLVETERLLEAGDRPAAELRLDEIDEDLVRASDDVGNALSVLRGVQEQSSLPVEGPTTPAFRSSIEQLRRANPAVSAEERLEQVRALQATLAGVEAQLEILQDVRPQTLVRPFVAQSKGPVEGVTAFDFYGPSVLMLLLQHLGVTFAALSLVRERALGTVELFGVSPVSAGEVVLGKCAAYLALGGVVAVFLTVSLHATVGLPFAGSVLAVVVTMGAVLLASLGIGFLVSVVSRSDTQAVQMSMLVALASFFFSGFFISLDRMAQATAWIGALLPATHGISMSRDVMLRGQPLPWGELWQLLLIAGITLIVVWRLFARQLKLA